AKGIPRPLPAAAANRELRVRASLEGKSGTGLHADKQAVFVIPDAKLTAEALKKHDKGVLPVGVMFITEAVTIVSGDKAVPADGHLSMEITVDNKTVKVHPITLAAARVADRLVLLAYAKDKKPAIVAELNEEEEKSDHGLDVSVRKAGDRRATVVVNVLSKYRACLQVAAKEE